MTNLSRGGVFIRGEHPLPLNTDVQLRFRLPDIDRTIETCGRVVWNYDVVMGTSHLVPRSGVKFVGLSPTDRAVIEKYLERLAVSARARVASATV